MPIPASNAVSSAIGNGYGYFKPDLTASLTTLKTEPPRPPRPRRKFYLWDFFIVLQDHALDSMLDAHDFPVEEEADGMSAQLEIGEQMGSMDSIGFLYL
jgi:hypothetical protein